MLLSFAAAAERPARAVIEGGDIARAMAAASVREDVAAGDPRVAQARAWLGRVTKATGEDERAVAAQCERTARWFLDMTKHRATSLEMLEALALLGRPGVPMQDTLRDYVLARRSTAGKTHAEALASLSPSK